MGNEKRGKRNRKKRKKSRKRDVEVISDILITRITIFLPKVGVTSS